MRLIDSIIVQRDNAARAVKLYVGDLSAIPAKEAVDLLVVSAFPSDYLPTSTSLIGALNRKGISLEALSKEKAVDLREFSACWLTREIASPAAGFRRILCFEPAVRGRAPEVVGDIFRSLIPFAGGTPPIREVAMPLVASGDQGEPKGIMLRAIVEAAVHWLSIGLPLNSIKIIVRDESDEPELRKVFSQIKAAIHDSAAPGSSPWRFDFFISYSHQDEPWVDFLVDVILKTRPSLRVFLDRLELRTGTPWQQHLYEAIDQSRRVVALFSPEYLASKVCLEEYNIAHFRNRESQESVLQPIYLKSTHLPTYMKLVQFFDARECDRAKLLEAAGHLVAAV